MRIFTLCIILIFGVGCKHEKKINNNSYLIATGKTYGSGFHYRYKNKIYNITASHVCLDIKSYEGLKVLYNSMKEDLCIIEHLHTISNVLTSSNTIKNKQMVEVFGFPDGLYERKTTCYSIGLFGKYKHSFNCFIIEGNSGGPVINSQGKVVAMVLSVIQSRMMLFALPINEINKVIDGLNVTR